MLATRKTLVDICKRDVEATLNPGREVRGCCLGFILGMPEISPFVFIAVSYQLHGISRTKEMLFQAVVFWVRRIFLVF